MIVSFNQQARLVERMIAVLSSTVYHSVVQKNESVQLTGIREEFEALLAAARVGLGELQKQRFGK